jgi:hypothetical protein
VSIVWKAFEQTAMYSITENEKWTAKDCLEKLDNKKIW